MKYLVDNLSHLKSNKTLHMMEQMVALLRKEFLMNNSNLINDVSYTYSSVM